MDVAAGGAADAAAPEAAVGPGRLRRPARPTAQAPARALAPSGPGRRLVAVVTEGLTEHSLAAARAVASAIDEAGYRSLLVSIRGDAWIAVDLGLPVDRRDFSLAIGGERVAFDFVWTYAEGTLTKGAFQSYLSSLRIPAFPPDAAVAALCGDKHRCKSRLLELGVRAPRGIKLAGLEPARLEAFAAEVGYPLMLKPNVGTDSHMNAKVDGPESLAAGAAAIIGAGSELLVEEFIDGRELSCGVIERGGVAVATPVTEIVFGAAFYDHRVKLTRDNTKLTPAPIPGSLALACQALTTRIAAAVGARGCARVDYLLRGDELFFLELNITPGMSARSILPRQLEAMGIALPRLLAEIVDRLIAEHPCRGAGLGAGALAQP